jgi:hypothetical protein
VAASAFIIEGEIKGTGKLYVLLSQKLQHRQYHGMVSLDLADSLPQNAGFVIPSFRCVGDLSGKRISHQVMVLNRCVDHHEQRGVGGTVTVAGQQLVARHIDYVLNSETVQLGTQDILHVVDQFWIVGFHESLSTQWYFRRDIC